MAVSEDRLHGGRDRLRLLYVEHQSAIGGAQRSLLELMRAIARRHEPVLACPEGPVAAAARGLGVPVVALPESQLTFRITARHTPREMVRSVRARRALRAHVRAVRPDVVHANTLRAGLIAMRLRAGPPLVVHCRDLLPDNAAADLVRATLLSRTRTVIAVSREVAASFAGPDWAGRGVVVVDNPVDTERFDPARFDREEVRGRLGVRGSPVIGLLAQITPWKRQTTAVRLIARLLASHPDAQLLLAGEAKFVGGATRYDNVAYERELHRLVDELGVRHAVHFLGEREDAENVLAALDMLLVPSIGEPFGRTIIEALAMNVPVLATNVGGPPDIIRPGIDGEVLPPDDLDAWLEAARRILAAPPAGESRTYAIDRFSRQRHADVMLDVYADVLRRRLRQERVAAASGAGEP